MSIRKGTKVIAEVADLSNYALNSNVVHQSGTDDNIQGTKRFKNTIFVDNAGGYYQKAPNITSATATPSSTQSAYPIIVYDNSGNQFAQVKVNVNADNAIGFMIKAKDNNWKTGLFCFGTSNGVYTYAPTPSAGDNSTKIATTAWINSFVIPNYSAGVAISSSYTTPRSGVIRLHFVRNNTGAGSCTINIDGRDITAGSNDFADIYQMFPVKKSSVITITSSGISSWDAEFFPYN